jgi:hypothetical protein
MADVALPLIALLRKGMPDKVQWTEECEIALTKLKTALASKPCLYPLDHKEFHISTDVSKGATAAWIGQTDDPGTIHPIAYASRELNGGQLKWSVGSIRDSPHSCQVHSRAW